MSLEKAFLAELNIFERETRQAAQFLYSELAVHLTASKTSAVQDLLNKTPLFWTTVLAALQTSVFITLGRIFDQNSPHNIDRLLKAAQKGHHEQQIFSRKALGIRKQDSQLDRPDWLSRCFMSKPPVPDVLIAGFVSDEIESIINRSQSLSFYS